MPNCRNCGARLTKFDKDICPVCGEKKPLEGVSSNTVEFTSQFDISDIKHEKVNIKKRWIAALLSFLVGFTSLQFIYLKYMKDAFVWFVANVVLFSAPFFFLFFTTNWVIALIVSLSLIYVANIVVGFIILFKPSLKDGNGELVR